MEKRIQVKKEAAELTREIEQTFADAKLKPTHKRHPELVAQEIFPILPNMESWIQS